MLSPLAARKAEKLGYKNVKVFHAGLPAWKKAGQIVVSNVVGLENFNKNEIPYILIDLRPSKEIEQGHIPNAVAVPTGGIEAMETQFPKYKGAAIILYNKDGNITSADEAFKKISGWGYKQASVLSGGFQAWEKSGQKVSKGAASSTITYVRKLMPGEVDIEVFKALLEKPSQDTILIDVRMASEVAANALPNTKNIPLDELAQRLSDLPNDKNIIVNCATGARAEMAYNVLKNALNRIPCDIACTRAEMGYNILKNAGLKVGYVNANVDFDEEKKGAYTISD